MFSNFIYHGLECVDGLVKACLGFDSGVLNVVWLFQTVLEGFV